MVEGRLRPSPYRTALIRSVALFLVQDGHRNRRYALEDVAWAMGVVTDIENVDGVSLDMAKEINDSFHYHRSRGSSFARVDLHELGIGKADKAPDARGGRSSRSRDSPESTKKMANRHTRLNPVVPEPQCLEQFDSSTKGKFFIFVDKFREADPRGSGKMRTTIGLFTSEETRMQKQDAVRLNLGFSINETLKVVRSMKAECIRRENKEKGRDRKSTPAERPDAKRRKAEAEVDVAQENLKSAITNLQLIDKGPEKRKPDDPDESQEKVKLTLYYSINGVRCENPMSLERNSVLTMDDLMRNLHPVKDMDKKLALNQNKKMKPAEFGKMSCWAPPNTDLLGKGRHSVLKTKSGYHDKLVEPLTKSKCTYSWEAVRVFMAFMATHSTRASTETIQMCMAGMILMQFTELGLSVDPEEVANMIPSQTTLVNWEMIFACECYLAQAYRFKGSPVACLGFDMGNKCKMDHLVKVITAAVINSDGMRIFESFMLDGNISGKTAQSAADDIERSLKLLKSVVGDDWRIFGVVADSGGGTSGPAVFPLLSEKDGLLSPFAKLVRCLMHALNLMLQKAMDNTVGSQGIKKDTCVQMVFLCVQLYDAIKQAGGLALVDEFHTAATEELVNNDEFIEEIQQFSPGAYEDFVADLTMKNDMEDIDVGDLGEAVDEILREDDSNAPATEDDLSASEPREESGEESGEESEEESEFVIGADDLVGFRQLNKPNALRWGSMYPAIKAVLKHFARFYSMAVLVKKSEQIKRRVKKSSNISNIVKYADELLKLMKKRADLEDTECPGTFYTQLLFLEGIGDWFYIRMLNCVMGTHQRYGEDGYGLTSYLWHVGSYILKGYVDKITEDTLRNDPEVKPYFEKYFENVDKIPRLGDIREGGREWYDRLPRAFQIGMRKAFNDHIDSVWRHDPVLTLLVSGPVALAHPFIRLLKHVRDGHSRDVFPFPSGSVNIPYFQADVDVGEFLQWVTSEADLSKVLEELDEVFDLLVDYAEEGANVDVPATLGAEGKYDKLVAFFHQKLDGLACQAQKTENHVHQMMLNSKNNKGEARRTWLCWIRSFITRRFNPWSVREHKAKAPAKRDKVKRLANKPRIKALAKFYYEDILPGIEAGRYSMSDDEFRELVRKLTSLNDKTSDSLLEEMTERLEAAKKEKRKFTVGESAEKGIFLPALMGGMISMSFLARNSGDRQHDEVLEEEIEARGKVLDKPVAEMRFKEATNILRVLEWQRLKDLNLHHRVNNEDDVKTFEPQSEGMKALLDVHQKWITEKASKRK